MGWIIRYQSEIFVISRSVFQGAEPVFHQLPCVFPFRNASFPGDKSEDYAR